MTDSLRIAWIHFAPEHKHKEKNLSRLLELNREAAAGGARILLNTELAPTGYTFRSREEVFSLVEEIPGPTSEAFGRLAKEHGVYVAVGLPETTRRTRMFYNSALLFDPSGRPAIHYRKINTEIRWACPGPVRQKNVVRTPWGRMGFLICSDLYHSLIPRVTALRGADLVLVPANWPTTGLDPRRIWRARARENHFFVAVCNRAGAEPELDARNAHSGLYGPDGRVLLETGSPQTALFFYDLPLSGGKIRPAGRRRLKRFRRPDLYHAVYLDLRSVRNLTTFYDLPEPGPFTVAAVPLRPSRSPSHTLEKIFNKLASLKRGVDAAVLPAGLFASADGTTHRRIQDELASMARRFQVGLFWGFERREGSTGVRFLAGARPDGTVHTHRDTHFVRDPDRSKETEFPFRLEVGSARIGAASVDELLQPEISVGLSKLGADLLAGCGDRQGEAERDVLATRSFDFVHLAAAGWGWALTVLPPENHMSWRMQVSTGDPVVTTLDTGDVRVKRFQDRVDVEQLLKP